MVREKALFLRWEMSKAVHELVGYKSRFTAANTLVRELEQRLKSSEDVIAQKKKIT